MGKTEKEDPPVGNVPLRKAPKQRLYLSYGGGDFEIGTIKGTVRGVVTGTMIIVDVTSDAGVEVGEQYTVDVEDMIRAIVDARAKAKAG